MSFHLIKTEHFGKQNLYSININDFIYNSEKINHFELLPFEKENRSEKRNRELIIGRLIKETIFKDDIVVYDKNGAPYLYNNSTKKKISISHADKYIGLIDSEFEVGLDIELITEKAKRVATKFTNKEEFKNFDLLSSIEMTQLWTMKEVMYKAAHKKGISFRNDILIERSGDNYYGHVRSDEVWYQTKINTFVRDNHIFSFNIQALVQE